MTYKHTYSSYIGDAHERVVVIVGDTFSEMLDIDAATEVGVFSIEKEKEDLDLGGGKFTQDSLSLTFDEIAARSDADADVIDLVASTGQGARVYVSLFINPPVPPSHSDGVFLGLIDQKYKQDESAWSGDQWSTTAAPVRTIKCTAKTFSAGVLSKLTPEDIFVGTDEIDGVLGDEAWLSTHVQSLPFYHDHINTTHLFSLQRQVSLTELIKKILSVCEQHVRAAIEEPTFELTLDITIATSPITFMAPGLLLPREGFNNGIDGYDFTQQSPTVVTLGDSSAVTEPYVHFGLVDYSKEDKDIAWGRYKSIYALIAALAHPFGMYFVPRWESATNLVLSYVPRTELITGVVYMHDVVRADRSVALGLTAPKRFFAQSTRYTPGGPMRLRNQRLYPEQFLADEDSASTEQISPEDGDESLALSVSPTLAVSETLVTLYVAPVNCADSLEMQEIFSFQEMAHTGIVVRDGDYYRHAIAVAATLGTEQINEMSLSRLLNRLYGREKQYFDDERSLTVPSLTQFSESTDGSSASWKHVRLGSQVVIDEDTYVVVGIERDLIKFETKLKLHRSGRFDVGPSSKTTDTILSGSHQSPTASSASASDDVAIVPAVEPMEQHDVVVITPSGQAARAQAIADHAHLACGIARQAAAIGEPVLVQLSGTITLPSAGISSGDVLWIVSAGAPSWNASVSAPAHFMLRQVGVAVATNTLLISPSTGVIAHPGMLT